MKKKSLSPREIRKSFRHAWDGLKDMMKTEHMAKVHATMTALVFALCWWLEITLEKFCVIVLTVVSVWVAESFNTVVEILTDHVSPEFSPMAKRSKDIGAGAVLITCIGAVIIGLIILGPPLSAKLGLSL